MPEVNIVDIKYFAKITPLAFNPMGDWVDLRCAETVVMHEGDYQLIPLGVAMQMPVGFEALMVPRSSTYAKYGIIMANNMGVIDHTYSGDMDEWHFPAIALRDTVIPFDERICQFRIIENQPMFRFRTVNSLKNKSRGGFGSTGYK